MAPATRFAALFALLLAACSSAPPAPSPDPRDAGPPPWALHAPVPAEDAPAVLMAQWRAAENRATCAPLTLAGVPDAAAPRAATFSGGWAVAWDQAGLPGRDASGQPCARCGRGAFGIAGTGGDAGGATWQWENERTWSDGSTAGWGLEGGTGPGFLAYVTIPGERCLYNVWSRVSLAHLESLIDSIRRVEGR